MSKKTEKLTFEESLDRLETILESIEDGDPNLTELIATFEEGATLIKACRKELQDAELKIEKLNLETGNLDTLKEQ